MSERKKVNFDNHTPLSNPGTRETNHDVVFFGELLYYFLTLLLVKSPVQTKKWNISPKNCKAVRY